MRYSLFALSVLSVCLMPDGMSQSRHSASLDVALSQLQTGQRYVMDMVIAPSGTIHAASIDKTRELPYYSDPSPQPTASPPSPLVVYTKMDGQTGATIETAFEMHRGEEMCVIALDDLNRAYIVFGWTIGGFAGAGIALFDSSTRLVGKNDNLGYGIATSLAACTSKDNEIVVTSWGQLFGWAIRIGEDLQKRFVNQDLKNSYETIAPLSNGFLITRPGVLVDSHGSQRGTNELLRYSVLGESLSVSDPSRQVPIVDVAEASVEGVELVKPVYVISGSSLLFFTTAQRSDGSVVTYRVRFDEKGDPIRRSQPSSIHLVTREAISQAGQPIHFGVLVKETSNPKEPRREPYFCGVTPEGDMFYYKSTVTFRPKPTLSQTLRGGRP